MKIVIYACVPVQASNGLYRRVRLVMDGMKVTSIEMPDTKWDHGSCYHTPTVNPYIDTYLDGNWPPTVRSRSNGVRYNLTSFDDEGTLC